MNWEEIQFFDPEVDKMLPCPCCGVMNINVQSLMMLDLARKYAGIPFKVTSCCRCRAHNDKVGGVDSSSHVCGDMDECYAFDIECDNSRQRFTIFKALLDAGFNRFGLDHNFIHTDFDPDKVEEVIWLY